MIDPASRYRDVPTLTLQTDAGRTVRYLGRRFPVSVSTPGETPHRVNAGDRPDLLAARALNDPLAFWRLAEANLLLDPWALTTQPGRIIRLPSSAVTFQVAGPGAG
jgi:hypothetical protein